ncbi:transposase [Actinomyces bovis]|uniref:transposase n=1 Tax=Actinomyces bovis TaxID=1658 RepID=UPI00389940BB
MRGAYWQANRAEGLRIAKIVLDVFLTCPSLQIARLRGTINPWRDVFWGYFASNGTSNGNTEAINGFIELTRRIARGFTNGMRAAVVEKRIRPHLPSGGGGTLEEVLDNSLLEAYRHTCSSGSRDW